MSEPHLQRSMDKWLKWAAILGPFLGFIFGICTGAWGTYQAFKDDDRRISMMENWKDKQDTFDASVVDSLARLQEIVKRIR